MFIKNKTKTWQSFMLGDDSFRMEPFGTIQIPDKNSDDGVLKLLLSRDVVEILDEDKGVEIINEKVAEEEAKAQENKIEVIGSTEEKAKTELATMVQCSAHNKNGNRCSSKVRVSAAEFDSDRPYFCGKHKNENPEDYEKIDGIFVKKDKPEETERVEEVKEEKVAEVTEATAKETEEPAEEAKEVVEQ